MDMVFCRGCGKKIHRTAPVCPQCGYTHTSEIGVRPSQLPEETIWIPVASMVFGIICLLALLDESDWDNETLFGLVTFSSLGLAFGILSIQKQRIGKGMAVAGVVMSAIALLSFIGLIF